MILYSRTAENDLKVLLFLAQDMHTDMDMIKKDQEIAEHVVYQLVCNYIARTT